MPVIPGSKRPAHHGFSYAEALLSIMLLAILLVPARQAPSTVISGSTSNPAARQFALRSNDTGLLYVNVDYAAAGSSSALNTLAGRRWKR